MKNSARSSPWKQIIQEHGDAFLQWLETSGVRFRMFDKLASDLERFLLQALANFAFAEMGEQEHCETFLAAIPKVLAKCDEDIYDQPLVAEAYAYVHLLDRYRRFWDVLIELTRRSILPMRDTGVDVLDVGTGPAPASFAVEDFYAALKEYAKNTGYSILDIPPPESQSVESSYQMVHLAHVLAEHVGKSGPFQATFNTFEGLDLEDARLSVRDVLERQMSDEEEPWMAGPVQDGEWIGKFRYNLVVFSNFLTEPSRVTELQQEIREVFGGLRAGGIVVVVGGTEKHYPDIYRIVEQIASESSVERMKRVSESIPCDYSDIYAQRIKQSYKTIWRYLEDHCRATSRWKSQIPPDVWDSDVPLKGPRQFGLRVFRKTWASPTLRRRRMSTKTRYRKSGGMMKSQG